jgi:hypothetical protein
VFRLMISNERLAVEKIMKKLLAVVALATLAATPVIAQQATNGRHDGRAARQERSQRVIPYAPAAPDIYYGRREMNENLNPDFQLGGER